MIYVPSNTEGESVIKGFDTELLDLLTAASCYYERSALDPYHDDNSRRALKQKYIQLMALCETIIVGVKE